MFPASTSQAKGRIERLWKTLQDRLITEFRINNITTFEQANLFFYKYISKYNKILPNVKVDIYISKKRGIIVIHDNIEYKVICGLDVPSRYSTKTAIQLYKENNAKVVEFATNMLTYDSKINEPLLMSS